MATTPDSATEPQPETRNVFISFSSKDGKQASAVCKALERRGAVCWLSSRDVRPGENYQEAIVGAIRRARAMVLVFSEAANNSDEIKKELSLASRHRIPILALRTEDVEPSDAFAYELSTRQWIDAFNGWERSLDALAERLDQISQTRPSEGAAAASPSPARRPRGRLYSSNTKIALAAAVGLLLAGVIGFLLLRPEPVTGQPIQVRLSGFEMLSPELPPALPEAIREENIAALGQVENVAVSSADEPLSGSAPAYDLGGTVRRDGDTIRVIARLANDRSGATLWSSDFRFEAPLLSRVPRQIAVNTGRVVRCGMFAASTYAKPMPDPVLSDFLRYCQHMGVEWQPTKALDAARQVVAAAPQFSWGWSAVANAAEAAFRRAASAAEKDTLRKEALAAADRAIALDPSNGQAMAMKSRLIDQNDLSGREALLRRAVGADARVSGFEHHVYGEFLEEVGRNAEATDQFRRSIDRHALIPYSHASAWGTLLVAGRTDQAKKHFEAYADLTGATPSARASLDLFAATLTGDHRRGISALTDPHLQLPDALRSALEDAFAALASNAPQAKAAAAAKLLALPVEMDPASKIFLLASLGRTADALGMVEAAVRSGQSYERSQLFTPALAPARSDPAFASVAQRLGLIGYWRKSGTKPDVCSAAAPPPVCQAI